MFPNTCNSSAIFLISGEVSKATSSLSVGSVGQTGLSALIDYRLRNTMKRDMVAKKEGRYRKERRERFIP